MPVPFDRKRAGATRNIALRIEYDGTDFVGSQWQNNGRSVQAALEEAWQQFAQERQRMTLAGRTDAGVHARGQVANVLTKTTHDVGTVVRGLNAYLPEDVAVLEAWEAASDFHARHSATQRAYTYLVDNGRVASPLLRRNTVHVGRRLDHVAMHDALQALVGRHDFAAFAAAGATDGPTVRTCYTVACTTTQLLGQPLIGVDIAASGFLHHMVRNIVGTALLVGEGKLDADGFAAVLAGGDRRKAGRTAPAHGLCLMSVSYTDQHP